MQRYKTLCKFWPIKIAIQGRVLFFFFFNCNDCVNCSKNLEFKIKPLVGQVVFIQLSFLLQNLQMGMSAIFQFATLVTFHMIAVWLSPLPRK